MPPSSLTIPEEHLQPPKFNNKKRPSSSPSATSTARSSSPCPSSSRRTTTTSTTSTNGSNYRDPCDLYATPLTAGNASCCPHLEAYLPTFLDSSGILSSPFDGRKENSRRRCVKTISDVHFASLFENANGTKISNTHNSDTTNNNGANIPTMLPFGSSKDYAFGEEEYKMNLVASGGMTSHYNPLHSKLFLHQRTAGTDDRYHTYPHKNKVLPSESTSSQPSSAKVTAETVPSSFSSSTTTMDQQQQKEEKPSLIQLEDNPQINSHNNNHSLKMKNQLPVQSSDQDQMQKYREDQLQRILQERHLLFTKSRVCSDNGSHGNNGKLKKAVNKKRNRTNNVVVTSSSSSSSSPSSQTNCDIVTNRISSSSFSSSQIDHISKSYTYDNKKHINYNTNKPSSSSERNDDGMSVHMAITKVEHWLDVIRSNRHRYWLLLKRRKARIGDTSNRMIPPQNQKGQEIHCKYCIKKKRNSTAMCTIAPTNTGVKSSTTAPETPNDDSLMECLDCSLIACGPSSCSTQKFKSKQHLMQHFLISGHSFGMTCGPNGSIWCAKCGDFVYHPVLEREKKRVDVQVHAKWLGWDRSRVTARSFGFSHDPMDDFVHITDVPTGGESDIMDTSMPKNESNKKIKIEDGGVDNGMVIWRGFRALYPTDVPHALIEAGQKTFQRIKIFHGLLSDSSSIELRKEAAKVALLSHHPSKSPIVCPVGLYNMGNTCYLGCVLQCLINLHPIQKYFLQEVKHDHSSCEILRCHLSSKQRIEKDSRQPCIGCEVDKLFLEYYGSTIGVNMMNAFEISDNNNINVRKNKENIIREKGLPISATNMLVELWKCQSMSLLAGYEQRDAHEFLQVFLDILSKDCRQFHSRAKKISEEITSKQSFQHPDESSYHDDGDVVTTLFRGSLRSILICDKCGFKRSQKEAFLNISIPLDKELKPEDNTILNESNPTRRKTSMRNKIDLKACLEKFVSPEFLSESLDCQWCKIKTCTIKQHTFAKLPKLLCLHLSRFDAAKNRKIDEPVTFPKQLNMGPYLPQW